jgi:Cytochrome P450
MSPANASIRSGLPPGPKGTLIGGNIRQFRAELLDFLLATARDYGPLASFRVGPRRVLLASGPDLIEQVLVTDAKHYIKHFGARAFKPVLGNGLVTSEGAFWQRQRKHSTVLEDPREILCAGYGQADQPDARVMDSEHIGSD